MSGSLVKQVGIALMLCPALAIMVVAVGFNDGVISADNVENLNPGEKSVPLYPYPTNEYGRTYGSAAEAPMLDEEPDLIAAHGDCGTIGYVYATDIDDPAPKTPEEAIARQEDIILKIFRSHQISPR